MSDDTPASPDVARFDYGELAEAEVIALCAFEPEYDDDISMCNALVVKCTLYSP